MSSGLSDRYTQYGEPLPHLPATPMTPREACDVVSLFGGALQGDDPAGVMDIEFPTVPDAAAWACATGMTRRVRFREPAVDFDRRVVAQLMTRPVTAADRQRAAGAAQLRAAAGVMRCWFAGLATPIAVLDSKAAVLDAGPS